MIKIIIILCDEDKNCTKNVQIYKFEKDKTYMIYFYPEVYFRSQKLKNKFGIGEEEIEEETAKEEEKGQEEEREKEKEKEEEKEKEKEKEQEDEKEDEKEPGPSYDKTYYYRRYAFFPINKNTFKNLEYGEYNFEGPKIVTTPIDNNQRYIFLDNHYIIRKY